MWTTKQRPGFTIESQVFMHIVGLNCTELDCLITIYKGNRYVIRFHTAYKRQYILTDYLILCNWHDYITPD